ncbi:MAG: type III pantothenate kinase, partial [Gammaproteobacteria bacterium]|nr:type III pantothenate kinase [Gammaproteobacteria bacterium]
MTLLVDAGNSRVKWGHYAQGALVPGASVGYDGPGLEANLENALGAIAPPARVLLCTVADDAASRRLVRWLRNRWPAPVAQVVPGRRGCGVRNAYAEPERLGADRWAALVGARAAFPGRPLCVVDAGTAVTVDALDEQGVHAGGLIVPGLALARGTLAERTGRIGSAEGGDEEGGLELGGSTRDAVRN